MASWAELLTVTEPGEQIVQLCGEDDQLLTRIVSRYLLRVCTWETDSSSLPPEHTRAVARHLVEEDPDGAPEPRSPGPLT